MYKRSTYSPKKLFIKQKEKKKLFCVPVITNVFRCFGVFRYFFEPQNYKIKYAHYYL